MPDSTVLITGASGAIGGALAAHVVGAGRAVALQYRTRNDELARMLRRSGLDPERHLFQADLTVEEDVSRLRAEVEDRLGPVGAVVNAAGATSNGMSWKVPASEFRRVVDANLTASFLVSQAFIPIMRAKNRGRIVNISSVAGVQGVVGAAHYCAAKAGLIGLTKAMALELARFSITVNVLALGYFDAGMIHSIPSELQAKIRDRIPLGRFGQLDEAVSVIEFLLSPASNYVTGQVLQANGGLC